MGISREIARRRMSNAGIYPATVTKKQVLEFRVILKKYLKESGIYNGTATLTRIKKDYKFIEMKTESWDKRECVSFNSDGFIGVAGWADKNNSMPITDAIAEWAFRVGSLRS